MSRRRSRGLAICGARVQWEEAGYITAADMAPSDMMEILGHNQIAVTMNIYTGCSMQEAPNPDRLRASCWSALVGADGFEPPTSAL